MTTSLPTPGTAYPVRLGESFASATLTDEGGLHLLRYDFKPASAGRAGQGSLKVDKSSRQVALEVPNSAEGGPILRFTGAYEQAGDGCDCIASFDGEQWHLELLSGQCRNLRVARAASGHLTEPPVKRPRPSSATSDSLLQAAQPALPPSQPQSRPGLQPQASQPSQAEFRDKAAGVEPRHEQQSPAATRKADRTAPLTAGLQEPPQEGQTTSQHQPRTVPDWQMGFVPEQDSSEDEDGSNQSDDDSNGDF